MKSIITTLAFALICSNLCAQESPLKQTIRGTIVDKESQVTLIGANVRVETSNPLQGASSDIDGIFRIEKVPVGRHTMTISYIGYEPILMNNITLTSGKELVLNIEMTESAELLDEVVISAEKQLDKTKALNSMAVNSARTFSVEETGRYAFSVFDPSRMAQNYAGVSVGAGDDLFNEIVIRGNSPAGVLWRMEGIEIPNPNHFGSLGNSGGAISMLSSSTLSNSDFFTGAFPAEYGNALSGVFDLKLRNGNNQKREHSVMVGALGIELATEGPFSKNSRASYLINYRYSTLGLLQQAGLNPAGDILPTYQDLSFKINVPTKSAGTFSLFGLGGTNLAAFEVVADSTQWELEDDREGFSEEGTTGIAGLSHRIILSDRSYLHNVAMVSYNNTFYEDYELLPEDNYRKLLDSSDQPTEKIVRVSSTLNHKVNAQNTLRLGAVYSHKQFDFFLDDFVDGAYSRVFSNAGKTGFIQSYAQWKHRLSEKLTLHSGLHFSLMTFNNKSAIEPRIGMQYAINQKQALSFSAGLHSKMESLALYTFEGVLDGGDLVINKKDNLGLTKAFHAVLGYDHNLNKDLRFKAEAYYQHLYNIPVENEVGSSYSLVNTVDIWDYISMESAVPEGTGRNIGLDLTFEKFLSRDFYYLATGSIFDSQYTNKDGTSFSTRYNGNFQLNLIGGKEFKMGKKKKNVLGVNAKFVSSGGNRYTPIDFVASAEQGEQVRIENRAYESRSPMYYRFDLGLKYSFNRSKATHSIMFDVQNITNRLNVYADYYEEETNTLEEYTLTGLFPNFNYRIEF